MPVWRSSLSSPGEDSRGQTPPLFDLRRRFSCASPCCSREAGSAFANAKHIHRVGEPGFPAAAALTCCVRGSAYTPSELSYLHAHPRSPVPPASTQHSRLVMPSPQQGGSITFVHQQPLAKRQQQQVGAEGCASTACGWLALASRL